MSQGDGVTAAAVALGQLMKSKQGQAQKQTSGKGQARQLGHPGSVVGGGAAGAAGGGMALGHVIAMVAGGNNQVGAGITGMEGSTGTNVMGGADMGSASGMGGV